MFSRTSCVWVTDLLVSVSELMLRYATAPIVTNSRNASVNPAAIFLPNVHMSSLLKYHRCLEDTRFSAQRLLIISTRDVMLITGRTRPPTRATSLTYSCVLFSWLAGYTCAIGTRM